MNGKTLAIIGASKGQVLLCKKAHEMGLRTICFAWEKGAVCKELVDTFYPISISEKDEIVKICHDEKVDGVVSNGSDFTAEVVSYVSEKLGLHGNSYDLFQKAKHKEYVRKVTESVPGLSVVENQLYSESLDVSAMLPCVVKPIVGGSKQGVSFAESPEQFAEAIQYAKNESSEKILIEKYITGREVSVESISFEGQHRVIQITDKDSSGAPHFVELGHHQPADLPETVQEAIRTVIPDILTAVGYQNGASHIEMKVDGDRLFLIEVNLRGGGDEISNRLVELSTGYDYIKGIIQVALGDFSFPEKLESKCAGIYYLCNQTRYLSDFFKRSDVPDYVVEKHVDSLELTESTGNYNRNGYMIYCSDHKITAEELIQGE